MKKASSQLKGVQRSRGSPGAKESFSPIELQVVNAKLNSVVEEMQRIIYRTGYSTTIRETRDASAGITDVNSRLIGQAFHLPLHMGVFTFAVKGLLQYYRLNEIDDGDIFVMNHPYIGGSPHAPDFMVVTPFFYKGEVFAFCCNVAHKVDIGGMVPGSLTTKAREVFQEGLHMPPVKYFRRGKLNPDVENIIRSNSRLPDEIVGDLRGQVGCTLIGKKRLAELADRYGLNTLRYVTDELIERSRSRLIALLRSHGDGDGQAEGFLDHDGIDLTKPRRIHVSTSIHDGGITFDFTKSDDQSEGPLNMRPTLLRAVCYYTTICFLDPSLPCNHALFEVVQLKTREGSIVDPRYPAAVNSYADVLRLTYHIVATSLGRVFPEKAVAAGGDNRGLNVSGTRGDKSRWIFYEIVGSGQGARQGVDGVSAISHFISNVAITPIEIVESEFPLMISEFSLVPDSGGPGKFRGGLGSRRAFKFFQDCVYVHRTGAFYVHPPWGLYGGKSGRVSKFAVVRTDGKVEHIDHAPGEYPIRTGDSAVLERAGGGGCGDPFTRDPSMVLGDVLDGYISREASEKDYGVAFRVGGPLEVDGERTKKLRSEATRR